MSCATGKQCPYNGQNNVVNNECDLPEFKPAGKWKKWEWELLVFIVIIVVILVIAAIVYFGFIRKGAPTGGSCNSNNDCDAYHYCAADFTCRQGSGNPNEGGYCNSADDCVVGQQCVNERCTSMGFTGTAGEFCKSNQDCNSDHDCSNGVCVLKTHRYTEQASFKDLQITYVDKDGRTYYLDITDSGSCWTQVGSRSRNAIDQIPSYDYEQVSKKLLVNIGQRQYPIIVDSAGSLVANNRSTMFTPITFIREGGVRTFRDQFNNQIEITCPKHNSNPRRSEIAFFKDSTRYREQPMNISSYRVYIDLVRVRPRETSKR